jgi:hypothetical protein
LDLLIFSLSIVFSIIGVGFDNLTTTIFIKDLGQEFESNALLRKVREKWGYKTWIGLETIVILIFGFIDFGLNFLFLGIFWGTSRGLVATYNFQNISEYRTIGIEIFKEDLHRHRQLFRGVSKINRYKMRLEYFMCFLFCILVFALMLLIGAYELESPIGLFLTVLVEGLILGIGAFFLLRFLRPT